MVFKKHKEKQLVASVLFGFLMSETRDEIIPQKSEKLLQLYYKEKKKKTVRSSPLVNKKAIERRRGWRQRRRK